MISKGNHYKFTHFVWLAVGEEAKQCPGLRVNVYCHDISFFVQCIIKQLLDSVFVSDIQNNQGRGKSYQPKPLY